MIKTVICDKCGKELAAGEFITNYDQCDYCLQCNIEMTIRDQEHELFEKLDVMRNRIIPEIMTLKGKIKDLKMELLKL